MAWTDIVIATPQGPKPGHRCDRHGSDFLRGEVCSDCAFDPGEDEQTFHAEYDRKLAVRIGEYRSNALALTRVAKKLLGDPGDEGTERDVAAACKAMAEATKLFRLAEERQEIIDNREHDLTLCAHEERMSAHRGGH